MDSKGNYELLASGYETGSCVLSAKMKGCGTYFVVGIGAFLAEHGIDLGVAATSDAAADFWDGGVVILPGLVQTGKSLAQLTAEDGLDLDGDGVADFQSVGPETVMDFGGFILEELSRNGLSFSSYTGEVRRTVYYTVSLETETTETNQAESDGMDAENANEPDGTQTADMEAEKTAGTEAEEVAE